MLGFILKFLLCVVGFLTLAAQGPGAQAASAEPPQVTVSVAPIHSLVAGVMEGTGSAPSLLFQPGRSPQTTALAPRQKRLLQQSDLVIWVGPRLETGLVRAMDALPASTARLQIDGVEGLTTWPLRSGGLLPLREAMHFHPHRTAYEKKLQAQKPVDPHFWTDPRNAQLMVWAIADALGAIDPDRSLRYQANAQAVVSRLSVLDSLLHEYVTQIRGRPYIVMHDAYQYAEHRYGLFMAGTILLNPAQRASAKRLSEIRRYIREARAVCLFHGPQADVPLIGTLTEGLSIRTAPLDPMGDTFAPGPDLYARIMAQFSEGLIECLAPDAAQ